LHLLVHLLASRSHRRLRGQTSFQFSQQPFRLRLGTFRRCSEKY